MNCQKYHNLCSSQFTIQNVPIKYELTEIKTLMQFDLQYKMFLLNNYEIVDFESLKGFTIQNVPIKCWANINS